jgi:hypothetical protein
MTEPLIQRTADWPGLLSALGARDGWSWLHDIPLPEACALLAAPAAVALWTASRAPAMAAKPAVSLLVIGAESVDAPDEGRWYQLVPQLLDARFELSVTLLGSELESGLASRAAAHAPTQPARRVRATLAEFLARDAPRQFDLAVVFHPGLQKHRSWLDEAGFGCLLGAGVPIVASSYETDEYEMDRWVLECYGYRASAEPIVNPFFLELGGERVSVRWGRALWQIEAAPSPAHVVNEEGLSALDNLTRMVMHSIAAAEPPSPGYGRAAALHTDTGAGVEVIHIFDNRYAERASGRILQLTPAGEMNVLGTLPPESLARYPGALARDIDRAIWAAEVKSSYLLGSYPPRVADTPPEATAQGMLAAMRRKAAGFFRK